ncbi:uncharacterized protein EV422DRAFT_530365 [Fimicolochytrium jonesii]|uniref:uncharacterized protein n=1 Tax=Fimicolochytrium jonesii TaxID=1396493 RepID=UPI0022FEA4E1|nr:uncharacterized protein EV422DRAFT_530365 [Fimicolochytrium jonesii]KAI8820828.1 hypothetical protein EV422DRAFT_530365 [Fimicolochytrium jonesii]
MKSAILLLALAPLALAQSTSVTSASSSARSTATATTSSAGARPTGAVNGTVPIAGNGTATNTTAPMHAGTCDPTKRAACFNGMTRDTLCSNPQNQNTAGACLAALTCDGEALTVRQMATLPQFACISAADGLINPPTAPLKPAATVPFTSPTPFQAAKAGASSLKDTVVVSGALMGAVAVAFMAAA